MLAATDLPTDPTTDLPTDPTTAIGSTSARDCTSARNCTSADDRTELPCWSAEPDLWFAESPSDVERAKALCLPCPLREACLSGALTRQEPWGVWGGQLVVAGVVVPRKRPRGRPRKDAAA